MATPRSTRSRSAGCGPSRNNELATGADQWPLVAKFFAHLEASAEAYWQVPEFELSRDAADEDDDDDSELESMEDDDDVEIDDDDDEDDEPWDDDDDDGRAVQRRLRRHGLSRQHRRRLRRRHHRRIHRRQRIRAGRRSPAARPAAGVPEHGRPAVATRRDRLEHRWPRPARSPQLLDNWCQQAVSRYDELLELLEAVHRFPIPQPTGSHDSMVEFDRQRMIKDSLLEHIIATCVETADAGRLILAASGQDKVGEARREVRIDRWRIGRRAARRAGRRCGSSRRAIGPSSPIGLTAQELLYVPLAKGGRPRRIVRARTLGQLLDDLLGWLPRLGLVRETCQLLDIAQAMETEHPVGPGAVTEYDRLFTRGYQAIVQRSSPRPKTGTPAAPPGRAVDRLAARARPTRCSSKRCRISPSRSSTAGSPTAARCG